MLAHKGPFSEEEEHRMIKEAEEEQKVKEKIYARNDLETYIYKVKNAINNKDKLTGKLEFDEKEKFETAVNGVLEWLEDNQNAEKKDYDEKLMEVEVVCNRVFSVVYLRAAVVSGTFDDDKGLLGKYEFHRNIIEEEERKVKEKMNARNELETYIYKVKNITNDKDKLAEKEKIETAVRDALVWLNDSQNAEKKDYDEKFKDVCNRMLTAYSLRSRPDVIDDINDEL